MLTHEELYVWSPALEAFAKRDLPFRVSLSAGKRVKLVRSLLKEVEEQRMKLVEKHAERDEDGEVVRADGGGAKLADAEAFQREFKELLECPVEEELRPIDWSGLEDKMPDLPANEVAALIALGLITDE